MKLRTVLLTSILGTTALVTTISYAGKFSIAPVKSPRVQKFCPDGWEIASGTPTGAYTCRPKQLTPISCPNGTVYYEENFLVGCQNIAK